MHSGKANGPAGLIGKTFPAMQLPYKAFGFDPFNQKIDQVSFAEMPEGLVVIYPTHTGNARYMVVAVPAGDAHRVVEVRPVAANAAKLRFLASSPTGGDVVTECMLNGKEPAQMFGFVSAGKKGRFNGLASSAGESAWIVKAGSTNVTALNKGDKWACNQAAYN